MVSALAEFERSEKTHANGLLATDSSFGAKPANAVAAVKGTDVKATLAEAWTGEPRIDAAQVSELLRAEQSIPSDRSINAWYN